MVVSGSYLGRSHLGSYLGNICPFDLPLAEPSPEAGYYDFPSGWPCVSMRTAENSLAPGNPGPTGPQPSSEPFCPHLGEILEAGHWADLGE